MENTEQCQLYVGSIAQYTFTVDSIALYPLYNVIILRNVHNKHVENENCMSSKAFPLYK